MRKSLIATALIILALALFRPLAGSALELSFPLRSAIDEFFQTIARILPPVAGPSITPGPDFDPKIALKGVKNGPLCLCDDSNPDIGVPDARVNCDGGACSLQLTCRVLFFDQSSGDLVQVEECPDFSLLSR